MSKIKKFAKKDVPILGLTHDPPKEMLDIWNDKDIFNSKISPITCNQKSPSTSSLFKRNNLRYLVMGNDDYNSFGGDL